MGSDSHAKHDDPGHANGHDDVEHDDHDHHHQLDTDALEPGEPHTPLWLPLLGCALFVLAGIVFLASGGDEPPAAGPEAAGSASAAEPSPAPSAE